MADLAWIIVLVIAPIMFVVGLVYYVLLSERDMEIAERRWQREQAEYEAREEWWK